MAVISLSDTMCLSHQGRARLPFAEHDSSSRQHRAEGKPPGCSCGSSSFAPGPPATLAAACQALPWCQVCCWPCVGTGNLGHSGGGDQQKNANGQMEECSAAQCLNTLLPQADWLPQAESPVPWSQAEWIPRMLIFSKLPCSWYQSSRHRAEGLL